VVLGSTSILGASRREAPAGIVVNSTKYIITCHEYTPKYRIALVACLERPQEGRINGFRGQSKKVVDFIESMLLIKRGSKLCFKVAVA
jgi:hypothetical protein